MSWLYWCATENSIVVAEGHLQHNGTFAVEALGLPPVESREESFKAIKVRRPSTSSSQETANQAVECPVLLPGGSSPPSLWAAWLLGVITVDAMEYRTSAQPAQLLWRRDWTSSVGRRSEAMTCCRQRRCTFAM